MLNPADDYRVRTLKEVALSGGERGPFYDRGVLDVVEEVERTGGYTPSTLLACIDLQKPSPFDCLAPDERAELMAELGRRGWTAEQGAAYAQGVSHAQSELRRYRRGA